MLAYLLRLHDRVSKARNRSPLKIRIDADRFVVHDSNRSALPEGAFLVLFLSDLPFDGQPLLKLLKGYGFPTNQDLALAHLLLWSINMQPSMVWTAYLLRSLIAPFDQL